MGKKSTKVLSGILATATLFGGAMGTISVSAATNLDAIYKNAYDAVVKAQKERSQQSVIAARKAIAQLAKENKLKGFVGEFSKQVDGVQQKLFNEFYSILFVDGKKKERISQEEINKARENIKVFDTYEGNKQYTPSWSSAVDTYQQKLIVEAHEAVVKSMGSKDSKDVELAENLVKSIETSTNNQTLDKSKELNAILKVLKDEIAESMIAKLNVKVDGDLVTVSGHVAVDGEMNMPTIVIKAGENLEDDATHIYHMEEIQCDKYGSFKATFNFSGNPKGKYTVNLKAKELITKDFDF